MSALFHVPADACDQPAPCPRRPYWRYDVRSGRVAGVLCPHCWTALPFPQNRHGAAGRPVRDSSASCSMCGRPWTSVAGGPAPSGPSVTDAPTRDTGSYPEHSKSHPATPPTPTPETSP